MHEGIRAGADGDAEVLERVQVVGRDVLVVEGDDPAAGHEVPERREVGVVTDHVVRDHLGRGDAGRLGQQTQRDAHRSGRLRQHPGQLTAADDRHDGRHDRRDTGVPSYGVRDWPGLTRSSVENRSGGAGLGRLRVAQGVGSAGRVELEAETVAAHRRDQAR